MSRRLSKFDREVTLLLRGNARALGNSDGARRKAITVKATMTGAELELATQRLWERPRFCSRCGRSNSPRILVQPVINNGVLAWGCVRCFHAPQEPRLPSKAKERRKALESRGQQSLFAE